jgi:predicted transposase/invertase (TIGR01784 family)
MLSQTGVAPIQKAVYVLHQMSEDEKIKELAWQREIALHDYVSNMKGAERKGIREVAKKFLSMGLSLEQVSEGTGLTLEEIGSLQN